MSGLREFVEALPDWRFNSACSDVDVEHAWFWNQPDFPKARLVCQKCPVREQCLEWALKNEDSGVWGGYSAYQRKQIRDGVAPGEALAPKPGRPRKANPGPVEVPDPTNMPQSEKFKWARTLSAEGVGPAEIAKRLKTGRTTIYRYLKTA
jgi:hypothetical protein